jgi:hypothetical protein
MTIRNRLAKPGRLAAIVAVILTLASCATAYQPRSMTGGYQERQLSEGRWYVEFFGNGNTKRDTVFGFWLNRCAELTIERGFDYFVFISKEPRSAQTESDVVRTAGKGAPSYIYVPGGGGTITTWSARGTIEMRRGEADPYDPRQQNARTLMAKLAPLMREAREGGGNITLPSDLLAATEERENPAPAGPSPVRLQDLEGLLPVEKQ